MNSTFASYDGNEYHPATSGVTLTWVLFANAPGRYHKTIVSPSPRIIVGLSSTGGKPSCGVILVGCFTRKAASRLTAAPDSLWPRSSASLLNSMPEGTAKVLFKQDCWRGHSL